MQVFPSYAIPVTPREFAMEAIPKGVVMLFKGVAEDVQPCTCDTNNTVVGKVCFLSRPSAHNRRIRFVFQEKTVTIPSAIFIGDRFFPTFCWEKKKCDLCHRNI